MYLLTKQDVTCTRKWMLIVHSLWVRNSECLEEGHFWANQLWPARCSQMMGKWLYPQKLCARVWRGIARGRKERECRRSPLLGLMEFALLDSGSSTHSLMFNLEFCTSVCIYTCMWSYMCVGTDMCVGQRTTSSVSQVPPALFLEAGSLINSEFTVG